jgi:hypothetical protein
LLYMLSHTTPHTNPRVNKRIVDTKKRKVTPRQVPRALRPALRGAHSSRATHTLTAYTARPSCVGCVHSSALLCRLPGCASTGCTHSPSADLHSSATLGFAHQDASRALTGALGRARSSGGCATGSARPARRSWTCSDRAGRDHVGVLCGHHNCVAVRASQLPRVYAKYS